jgi:hypothetical protein
LLRYGAGTSSPTPSPASSYEILFMSTFNMNGITGTINVTQVCARVWGMGWAVLTDVM